MRWYRFGTDFFVCDCEKLKMYWMYIEFFGKMQTGKDVRKMCHRINQRFLKSLTGDSADNIPGIPSVGSRTASALLGTFGDLDSLLARVGEVRRPALQKALREGRERLMTNRRLIRLDREVPLPFTREALACPPATLTTAQVLEGIGVR